MTNEIIAEKIMGFEFVQKVYDSNLDYLYHEWIIGIEFKETPDFLNNHNAAMMVVEKMREDGWKWGAGTLDSGGHFFDFYRGDYVEFRGEDESLCHAIAEAALKAKSN